MMIPGGEPGDGDGAVVHVVDQVRRDEGERGQLTVGQIGGQLGVGHVVTGATVQRRVVRGRVVPYGVLAGVAGIAARRHRLLAGVGTARLEQAAAPRSATVAAQSAYPANLVRLTIMVQTLSQIKVRMADGGKSRTVAGCFIRVAHAS
jgi:hypothetical protein